MSESDYDEVIAPMLAEVANKCQEFGMAMVARVEWEPGEAGITQIGNNRWSPEQMLAAAAAMAHGNIDKLVVAMQKQYGEGDSIVLNLISRGLP